MRKSTIGLLALAVGLMLSAMVGAQDAAAPATQDLTGKVSVTQGADGKVSAVTLTVGEKAYSVNLDEQGQKLAAAKDKTVKATCVVTEGAVTVKAFSVVEEKPAAPVAE